MKIILESTQNTKNKVRKLAAFFDTLSLNSSVREDLEYVVRSGFDDNFRSEGTISGPWKPLAPWTQRVRASKGYNPKHPILQRTGGLRRSFAPGGALGFRKYEVRGGKRGVAVLQFGSSHPLAALLEGGDPSSNIPPRPIASEIDSAYRDELTDVLNEFFHYMEGQM